MKNHRSWFLPSLLAALILVTSGGCSAFPPKSNEQGDTRKRVKVPFDARRYALTFLEHHPRRTGTDLSRRYQHRRRLLQQRTNSGSRSVSTTVASSTASQAPNAISGSISKTTKTATKDNKLKKVDFAIFVTYFCNIAVVTLSVVTVPAIAMEHNLSPRATAAFCASMASMAPLGGFVGKLVNGFVCQRLGGQRSSWVYMLAMASLSLGMSFSRSLAPIGLFLVGFEFLTSIQWTSNSDVLNRHYRQNPRLMARGMTLLSVSSTVGALVAKTFGAGLLEATHWRTVYRYGALTALVGAAAIYFGGAQKPGLRENAGNSFTNSRDAPKAATKVSAGGKQKQSPFAALKNVLSNPVFWMIGIGHSLGHIARVSDRLLGPFLQEVGGISSKWDVSSILPLINARRNFVERATIKGEK